MCNVGILSGMEKIQIYLSELQIKKLRELSEKTGLSFAEHVRRAIDAYLKRVKE